MPCYDTSSSFFDDLDRQHHYHPHPLLGPLEVHSSSAIFRAPPSSPSPIEEPNSPPKIHNLDPAIKKLIESINRTHSTPSIFPFDLVNNTTKEKTEPRMGAILDAIDAMARVIALTPTEGVQFQRLHKLILDSATVKALSLTWASSFLTKHVAQK